jgi:hypothetical protein
LVFLFLVNVFSQKKKGKERVKLIHSSLLFLKKKKKEICCLVLNTNNRLEPSRCIKKGGGRRVGQKNLVAKQQNPHIQTQNPLYPFSFFSFHNVNDPLAGSPTSTLLRLLLLLDGKAG